MIARSTRTILLLLLAAAFAVPAPAAAPDLPKEKRTALGLYATAAEAYEMWKAGPAKVKVLDVRTTEEYIFIGHPAMAWNVPFAVQSYEWDGERKHFAMKPNPDFVAQIKAIAAPEDTILVLCRSGGRSARAVNLLAEAGYKHAYTVTDGMEGDLVDDPESVFHGKRMKNGWKNAGLPWTYDLDIGRIRVTVERKEP